MTGPDPAEHGWWLASRASGIVALLCITLSVAVGLAMAGRVGAVQERRRLLLGLHQHTALVGLVAVAVHGISLLGDAFLRPRLVELAVPFLIEHERLWTGLGVTAGWLAAALGLSYWARDRIGPARWRSLHRATLAVYVLAVAHTLGSGTDAGAPWMRLMLLVTGAPVLFLFVMRVMGARGPHQPAAPAFRRLRVSGVAPESRTVSSFSLEPADDRPLAGFSPGQFVSVRVEVPGRGSLVRSYSLSGPADAGRYRISVKREPEGAVSGHLHGAIRVGDVIDVSEPRGGFVLDHGSGRPVVLVSAGIGVTPVLAMLAALARERDPREVWWVHGARCGADHAFREEARRLVERLPAGRTHVCYSRPGDGDVAGRDFDATGRMTAGALLDSGAPATGDFYVCGPERFIDELRDGLLGAGVAPAAVRSERFSAATGAPAGAGAGAAGGRIEFARSGVSARWDPRVGSLLELAEGCGVAAPYSCRVGDCHACATEVLDGRVNHALEPGSAPGRGMALLCCSRPEGDVRLAL